MTRFLSGIYHCIAEFSLCIDINRFNIRHPGKDITGHKVKQVFIFSIYGGQDFIRSNLATLNLVRRFDIVRPHLPALVHIIVHFLEKAFSIFEYRVRKLEIS